ncbi:MAG: nickel transporter [Planctomycetes bacterium]|nr:nickel transporter [Planctomycetota bacterium]
MLTLSALVSGLIAGTAHVFAGPDHLAAVAPLALEKRRSPLVTGLLWGVGHSGGFWSLAIVAILLRDALPLEWLSSWSERLVGVVLIGIGLWTIKKALSIRIHTHVHKHDGVVHGHVHVHEAGMDGHDRVAHSHDHRALGIGLLHGVAGTSHILGILPALMLPSGLAAIAYVVGFGLGSICGMSAFSWLIGRMAVRVARTHRRASQFLFVGSGVAAIAIGFFWLTV